MFVAHLAQLCLRSCTSCLRALAGGRKLRTVLRVMSAYHLKTSERAMFLTFTLPNCVVDKLFRLHTLSQVPSVHCSIAATAWRAKWKKWLHFTFRHFILKIFKPTFVVKIELSIEFEEVAVIDSIQEGGDNVFLMSYGRIFRRNLGAKIKYTGFYRRI